jgi:hypothetical protein
MTDTDQSPPTERSAALGAPAPSRGPGDPSPRAVDALRRTRPWTLFIAILGFVGAGLLGLAAIVMAIGGVVGSGFGGGAEAGMVLGMAAMYAILTAVYVVISVALFKYARSIGEVVRTNRAPELEDALEAQRGFWKLMGIVIIVMMALMVLAFIVGIVVAVAIGASSGF